MIASKDIPATANIIPLVLLGWMVATVFTFAISSILPVIRFYNNLLKDEGYLMFTLPVTEGQLYLSKLITAVFGNYLAAVVIGGSFFLGFYSPDFGPELRLAFSDLTTLLESSFGQTDLVAFLITIGILLTLSPLQSFSTLFAAMAIGQTAAKRPILSSVVVYFGINGIVNFAQSVVFTFLAEMMGDLSVVQAQSVLNLSSIAFALISTIALSIIAVHFLKNRKNLI